MYIQSMTKFLISLLITFSLLITVPVSAQTCPPIPTLAVPIPGLQTCGNANDPCNNKCCVFKEIPGLKDIYNIPIFGQVLKQINMQQDQNIIGRTLAFVSEQKITPCSSGTPSTPGDLGNPGCICVQPTPIPFNKLKKMCANIKNAGEKGECEACMGGDNEVNVWTSVGCVKSNVGSFIQDTLLGWGVGIAGGVSMLCIMYAAFMMQTSGGEAEKIKKAQQLMTSCITGLMIIIFSVFILQLIGVKILRIPWFG